MAVVLAVRVLAVRLWACHDCTDVMLDVGLAAVMSAVTARSSCSPFVFEPATAARASCSPFVSLPRCPT
ncbi:hypothetical protein PF010_g31270 [Phytophthora fragariae]|uniref:Secreted protein n=1 Tax=Phytophthora fragariae TaxID=53985 RepID=A0A6A3PWR1_9STRA|nr:hypothetical protein PF003_g8958 [Phytophthora fragariae]KAE8907180.1 hypothetical protein PF003_g8956 [Phytophthora fragariae]KAE9057710.1 hypothetical protein PF010_g31270 [Phytophthora fragariae]KAE9062029.1 hypothetical protein PF006_g31256 [Phytophthora fragariae]KAE9161240.1 hypothetical protein PF004_g30902 [Phytophthora fragariae]